MIVIIPAYNEEDNIAGVIDGVKKDMPGADILVVDDSSSDATSGICKKKGVITLKNPINLGYASTCQTGFKYACERDYGYIVQMDGDGQHPTRYISALLGPVMEGEADLCIGSRFLKDGYRTSLPRRIGMSLFSFIATTISRKKITDPTSGFQAFNRKVLKVYCTDVYPEDYPDADLIIKMHLAGFRLLEVPVKMYPNNRKSMHNFFSSTTYVVKMLLSILVALVTKSYVKKIMEG